MKKLTSVLAIATLALAACGGDDGGSGDSGDKAKLMSLMTADGTEGLDDACLEAAVNKLSNSDASFLVDNFDATDMPKDAPAGAVEFATSAIFDCIDFSDIDFGDSESGE